MITMGESGPLAILVGFRQLLVFASNHVTGIIADIGKSNMPCTIFRYGMFDFPIPASMGTTVSKESLCISPAP